MGRLNLREALIIALCLLSLVRSYLQRIICTSNFRHIESRTLSTVSTCPHTVQTRKARLKNTQTTHNNMPQTSATFNNESKSALHTLAHSTRTWRKVARIRHSGRLGYTYDSHGPPGQNRSICAVLLRLCLYLLLESRTTIVKHKCKRIMFHQRACLTTLTGCSVRCTQEAKAQI